MLFLGVTSWVSPYLPCQVPRFLSGITGLTWTCLFFSFPPGINKRGAKNCNAIRHFENTFVVETVICGVV